MSENPNFILKPIKKLADFRFVVADYQRGYKWDVQQVLDLLEDINGFDKSKQGFYCLQPVVVKVIKDKQFELIDGQQRTTTIFILLAILKKQKHLTISTDYFYTIDYQTRPESAIFLKDINTIEFSEFQEPITQPQINKVWEAYIANYPKKDNVDNYHFFMAYQVIGHWLKQKSDAEIEVFREKLLINTEVIWYKINKDTNQTAEKVFINFNQGKINLAQAELIKALFVLELQKEANKELQAFKINQFAQEWNTIESKLQQDEFWYFISNDTSDTHKSNRIDFLFDIIQKKGKGERDKLFSYRKYLEKFNTHKAKEEADDILEWSVVNKHFDIFLEWYEDRSIYHLVGFLVNVQLKDISISTILEVYEQAKTKDDFKSTILNWIKAEFLDKEIYSLDNLGYDSKIKQNTFKILLLFNIITYENSDRSYRFPFSASKENKWSLEHIHAQNPKDFETITEVKEWLNDLKGLSKNYQKDQEFKSLTLDFEPIDTVIETFDENDEINRNLKDKINGLMEEADRVFNKDSLDNLCLLDTVTNSSFNNDNFVSKRKKLIAIDKKGFVVHNGKVKKPFIPITTKHVFLKYYTAGENVQMTYWGIEDKKAYKEAIRTTLETYLNPKNG